MNLFNKLFKNEKKTIPSMVTTDSNTVYSNKSNLSSGNKSNQEVSDGTILEEEEYEVVEIEILPEKMICPDCGGITLVGLEFCDKCGGELTNLDV